MIIYEFKAKGNKKQYSNIDKSFRISQFIRNKAVRLWMDNGCTRNEISLLASSLAKEFEFANDLGSTARQSATERAWCSIARFYQSRKNNQACQNGYPRFKKNNRSIEHKKCGWKLSEDGKKITFTDGCNIGTLKLFGTRSIRDVKRNIQRVRLIKRADGYYVQFIIKIDRVESAPVTGSCIGLDVGLTYFYTDSNGERKEPLRALKKSEKQIKRVNRSVNKKVKGSNNRKKAINKLSKKHLKVQRQRKDFAVKTARALFQSHDVVVIEDLRVTQLISKSRYRKAIGDAGWYQFRLWLERYSKVFNKTLIVVPPNYTSQDCSNCGNRIKKDLSIRVHRCECGLVLDRDHNAAINILMKGINTVGHTEINACGESNLCMDALNDPEHIASLDARTAFAGCQIMSSVL